MALLTAQPTVATGLTPSYAAVAASDTFVPGPYRILHLLNTNAATRTVTLTTTGTGPGGVSITDWVGTIGATTGSLMFGVLPGNVFADGTTGVATVTCSATAGVTIALIDVSPPAGA
jgi:hypothetical protein